jgi:hypothetical protein
MLLLTVLACAALGVPQPEQFEIDLPAIRASLENAPPEFSGLPGALVDLPMPDGSREIFEAWDSPIMDPALAARHPLIRTYAARSLSSAAGVARIDLTHVGLHAIVRSPKGTILVSAVPRNPSRIRSMRWEDAAGGQWECEVGPQHGQAAAANGTYDQRGPLPLRTYRLAMACTGEFAEFHSARQGNPTNFNDAFAAIVTITNRTNFVLEQDLGVRLLLVPNNDLLVFLDPATDPYHPTDSGANLSANITTCNTIIGFANYDIGHLVTRIPGGVAYLSAVCGTNKAGGVSGSPRTVEPDPLNGEVVWHEVGHQFGAGHTFNGNVDRCLNNRSASSAWEPGSGTTILAYPGNCPVGNDPPGDNIQITRDVMYHLGSILQMRSFLNAGGNACVATTATGHSAPAFTSLPPATGLVVPRLTPFELTGSASDPDGDSVTWSWEQFDLGPQQSLTGPDSADNGTSPLFRVFPPTTSGSRLFPRISDALSGILTPGEELPSVAPSTRRFRACIRDNHPGAGGVTISAIIQVQVASDTGPFEVTSPAPGQVLYTGPATVTWNVAGTTGAPLNTSTVTILLSTDAGQTFPVVLAAGTPNDGEATVLLPPVSTANAHIRILADGGIYSAFSRAFTILPCQSDLNCDGSSDGFDIETMEQVVAGNLPDFCLPDTDFNNDGSVDGFDIEAVEQVVAGGPCP